MRVHGERFKIANPWDFCQGLFESNLTTCVATFRVHRLHSIHSLCNACQSLSSSAKLQVPMASGESAEGLLQLLSCSALRLASRFRSRALSAAGQAEFSNGREEGSPDAKDEALIFDLNGRCCDYN